MRDRLAGKVAIVTGGGQGIGEGCCRAMAEEGASIVIADIDDKLASATASSIASTGSKAIFVHTDVTDYASIQACVKKTIDTFGRLDILVNNAGTHWHHTLETLTPEQWDKMFAINLKSNFLFCKAAMPEIRKTKGAVIIMSSIRGLLGQENGLAYAASKAGQIGLAKSLANDEAKHGVRVNAVCPSSVKTPLMQKWLSQLPNEAEVRKRSEDEQAMGRMADIMEIGRVVAFLASDDASFVTGLAMPIDGGMLLR